MQSAFYAVAKTVLYVSVHTYTLIYVPVLHDQMPLWCEPTYTRLLRKQNCLTNVPSAE